MAPPIVETVFEIAGGTIAGSSHVAAGRNNQDAFCWARNDSNLIALVCDGCSSGMHADVGANLGARLFVHAVSRLLGRGIAPDVLLGRAREEVAMHLRLLATAMSSELASGRGRGAITPYARTVIDHFLFTVVGVLIDGGWATTFALGDGLVVVNGERVELGPFVDNEPPYLGYDLLELRVDGVVKHPFVLHDRMPAADVDTMLIGTDGVFDLERAEGLNQFWRDDRFFRNADMVRRQLTILQRRVPHGLLPDDTTLLVLRRAPEVDS